jgi:hypothetical protein
MAGSSVTFTEMTHGSVKCVKAAWVSDDATGAVSAKTTRTYDGRCIGLATVPGTVGDQPTDNYDLAVTDANGFDVLLGAGQNRDNVNTEYVAEASMAGVPGCQITFAITNAGNAKKGTAYLWIR